MCRKTVYPAIDRPNPTEPQGSMVPHFAYEHLLESFRRYCQIVCNVRLIYEISVTSIVYKIFVCLSRGCDEYFLFPATDSDRSSQKRNAPCGTREPWLPFGMVTIRKKQLTFKTKQTAMCAKGGGKRQKLTIESAKVKKILGNFQNPLDYCFSLYYNGNRQDKT